MKTAAVFLLFLFCAGSAIAQELPRRPFLGIQMRPLPAELREAAGLADSSGVLIDQVFSDGTAAAAGFRKGDILLRLHDKPVPDTRTAVDMVAAQRSGSRFRYEILRNGKHITGSAAYKPFPQESYPDLSVSYEEARSGTGLQRIILTRPKSAAGRLPLIVFIGGIGCYSLDAPKDTGRSELRLLNGLARSGFATARLEKPGMGDGAGFSKACSTISFEEEAEAYVAAIEKLKARPDIQADAVYVIGHSMGGVFAPQVAQQTAISGIIAYGTIGSNFLEHLAKTRRTIGEASGWSPEETDAYIRDFCACAAFYYSERMSTAEAAAKRPDCRQYLGIFDIRSRAYNEALYAMNVPALWKNYTGRVLLLWGESDFIASRHDHQILAEAINYYHKGSARFMPVPASDHGMQQAASFGAAREDPGPYNRAVGDIILSWLKGQS